MPGGHGGMGHDMPLDRCAMNVSRDPPSCAGNGDGD